MNSSDSCPSVIRITSLTGGGPYVVTAQGNGLLVTDQSSGNTFLVNFQLIDFADLTAQQQADFCDLAATCSSSIVNIECYQEPTLSPFEFNNIAAGGTPVSAAGSGIVFTVNEQLTLGSIGVESATQFSQFAVDLQIREGANQGGTVLFTSDNTNTITGIRTENVYNFSGVTLPPGTYTFTFAATLPILFYTLADTDPAVDLVNGGVLQGLDPMVRVSGNNVNPAGELYNVITNIDGTQVAYRLSDNTEVDISAGLPATWTSCDQPPADSYVSRVALEGSDLTFEGEELGFNGVIDMATFRDHRANLVENPPSSYSVSQEDIGKLFILDTAGIGDQLSVSYGNTGDAVVYVKNLVDGGRIQLVAPGEMRVLDADGNVVTSQTGGIFSTALPETDVIYKVALKDGNVDVIPFAINQREPEVAGSSILNDYANLDAVTWSTTQNNLALPSGTGYRFDLTTDPDLTGIVAPTEDTVLLLFNVAAGGDLVIQNQNTASAPENRFITPEGLPYRIRNGGSEYVRYDTTLQRWHILAGN